MNLWLIGHYNVVIRTVADVFYIVKYHYSKQIVLRNYIIPAIITKTTILLLLNKLSLHKNECSFNSKLSS